MNKCVTAFGDDEVVFNLGELNEYSIKGIFDNEFEIVDPDTDATVISTRPVINLRDSEVTHEILEDDEILVSGKAYKVFEVNADKKGLLTIFLHEA